MASALEPKTVEMQSLGHVKGGRQEAVVGPFDTDFRSRTVSRGQQRHCSRAEAASLQRNSIMTGPQ